MNQDCADAPSLSGADPAVAQVPRPMGRARVATSLLFLVDGMTFGTWAALIPAFQAKHALSEGRLSWVLLALVVGALISMPLAGRLVARWGSHRVGFAAGIGFPCMLPVLALAPNFWTLLGAGVLFGAWKGALDVSVNAQGITVEKAAARPIFSSFQAYWSVGGLTAAFLLTVAMNHGWGAMTLMHVLAVGFVGMTLATWGGLLPDAAARVAHEGRRGFRRPGGPLILLGGLAFLGLFSEGVLLDWSAVYARTVVEVPVSTAPMAFAAFALCMAGGRFVGDALVARFGPEGVLRISGVLMTAGIAVAVFFPVWPAVLAGFATVGLGIANLVPVIFGAAGRTKTAGGAGPAIAAVTTMGYFGFLSGPPVVGFIAAHASLPVAFGLVVVFGVILATLGVRVLRLSARGGDSFCCVRRRGLA